MMIEERTPNARYAPIPRGVADYFWEEAYRRRDLEASLLDLFRRWGYGDVIPPTFEYADVLNARASDKLRSEMYRFLDRDGSTLALRLDMTIPVARLVSTRLHDWPMPQRFCYAGSVFRYTQPQAGREREFRQAGVELIGAATPEADAEVLALTCAGLEQAGLKNFRLVIGQMSYFHGLLDDLQLTPDRQQALLDAVDRNSEAELAEFLRTTPLRAQQRRTMEELFSLRGAEIDKVIQQADRLCLNYAMHAALENLRAICASLDAYGACDYVYLDLTEIYNLGYYTGITFEALTPELGFSVAGGGRYDNLLGAFGESHPAVGVALGVDRILLALDEQRGKSPLLRPRPADLAVMARSDAACMSLVQAWRQSGLRVEVALDQTNEVEVWRAARARGVYALLVWDEGRFRLYTGENEHPALLSDEEVRVYINKLSYGTYDDYTKQ